MGNQIEITVPQMKELLRHFAGKLWEGGPHKVLAAYSAPGVGKSEGAAQVAKELDVPFQTLFLSQEGIENFKFPAPNYEKGTLDWLTNSQLPFEDNKVFGERGLLIVEEAANADDTMRKLAMELTLNGQIGGRKLKKGWLRCTLSNRVSDRSGSSAPFLAQSNRLCNVYVKPDIQSSLGWWVETGKGHPIVLAFLRLRPEFLHKVDWNVYSSGDFGVPTPRSWTNVMDLFYNPPPSDELFLAELAGWVGTGCALELNTFKIIKDDMPDIDQILKEGKGRVPKEPSVLYATVSALVLRAEKKLLPNIFKYVVKLPMDYQAVFVKDAVRHLGDKLTGSAEYRDWVKENTDKILG